MKNTNRKFYVLMLIGSAILDKDGFPPRVRWSPPDARSIEVTKNIPTFVYQNPVTKTYAINEVTTGMEIASGPSVEAAVAEAKKFFAEANEVMFFRQMQAMGKHDLRPTITVDEAMEHTKVAIRKVAQGAIRMALKK